MSIKFTSMGSMAQITMAAALQTLAIDLVALSSVAESNDDPTERNLFRNFAVKLGTMDGARVLADPVSLVIVPVLGTITGDTTAAGLGAPYIATDKDGNKVTWTLDAAVTARNLTWANVCIPNGDYHIGVLNGCTAQAFAGTNEVWASSAFSVENVT